MPGPPTAPTCLLSVEETPGTLAIIDRSGKIVRVAIGERPHEVIASADGRTAWVTQFGIADYDNRIGTPGDRVVEIDLASAKRVADLMLPDGLRGPHGIKLRPGTRELYVNNEVGGDHMLVFDSRTRKLVRSFAMPAATHNFVFSNDGRYIYSFAGAKGVSKVDATTGAVAAFYSPGTPVRGLWVTRRGTVLAGAKGAVYELAPGDLAVIRKLDAPRPGQYLYLDEGADGTIFAPSLGDGGVAIFPGVGGPVRFVPTGKAPIFARVGPDGLVYVENVEDDHVTVLDASGAVVRTIQGLTTPNGIAFGRCPT